MFDYNINYPIQFYFQQTKKTNITSFDWLIQVVKNKSFLFLRYLTHKFFKLVSLEEFIQFTFV